MRDTLGLLRRRSLLEWDAEPERYRLHELVRAFAAARLADADAVHLRYAWYYAQIANRANDLYLQGGEQMLAGLALFDAERAHIDAGWGWAREQAGVQVVDELLMGYTNATAYTGSLRYHMRHARIPQLEATLVAAQRLGHKGAEGAVLGNLGLAYADLGEVRRAIEFYEQHLAIAREIGDRRGEGNALGNLGIAYADLDELRRAIEFYEQSLTIKRGIGDRRGEANTLFNTSLALDKLGDRAQAIVHAEAALRIYEQIESPYAERVREQLARWSEQEPPED